MELSSSSAVAGPVGQSQAVLKHVLWSLASLHRQLVAPARYSCRGHLACSGRSESLTLPSRQTVLKHVLAGLVGFIARGSWLNQQDSSSCKSFS
jgi:hypothetical protein